MGDDFSTFIRRDLMDKTIDTTPYVQRFQSSYNYDYYQKHNKNCIFILSSSYVLTFLSLKSNTRITYPN